MEDSPHAAAEYPSEPPDPWRRPAPAPPPPVRPWWRRPAVVAVAVALLAAAAVVWSTGSDEPGSLERSDGASSTAPAGPEAPPTLPPADPALQDDIDDLRAYVADARGLEFRSEVPVHTLGVDDFSTAVETSFQVDAAEVAALAAYYEALGLIPEGSAAFYADELRLRYQSVLGFYDPESGALVVRGAELGPALRSVIVHELVHALDDQWFELHRPAYAVDAVSEHETSFPMVIEGDAVRVQEQWIEEQPAAVRAEIRETVGEDPSGHLSDNADFLDFGILSPYQAGTPFVAHLAETGGERLVDAVLIDPPGTTEQVLYPEVFDRREGRLPVPPPATEGQVIDQGVVGASFWLGLLTYAESPVTPAEAEAATRGWGGDWQVTWVAGQQSCTRTDVQGDTPADTAELLAALTTYASTHPRVTVSEVDGRARMEVCYEVPVAGADVT